MTADVKVATYHLPDGTTRDVEYDPTAPCISCGLPVVSASIGGTVICPWCDCGVHRDGREWTYREAVKFGENAARALKSPTEGAR